MNSFQLIGLFLVLLFNFSYGRRYDMCSLARELHRTHGIAKSELPDWVCMAEHESEFKTDAMNKKNSDGSWDWGIFQINDRYWCHNSERPGKSNGCNMNCNQLVSNDISASVRCAKIIKRVHGWGAWVAWRNQCQYNKPNINSCNL